MRFFNWLFFWRKKKIGVDKAFGPDQTIESVYTRGLKGEEFISSRILPKPTPTPSKGSTIVHGGFTPRDPKKYLESLNQPIFEYDDELQRAERRARLRREEKIESSDPVTGLLVGLAVEAAMDSFSSSSSDSSSFDSSPSIDTSDYSGGGGDFSGGGASGEW